MCVSFLALPHTAVGQASSGRVDSLAGQLAAYMQPYTAMGDFSGRILIAKAGVVLFDTAFTAPGTRASRRDTRFGIGSVTKTFTAAAIGLLAERGKLRLSDSLGKYLPELGAGRAATIAQALDHASGIPDYYTQPEYPSLRTRPISLTRFATWIGAKPLDFAPGTRGSYSNSGYALLALIIERASGMPYAQYIETALLRPLGLRATGQLATVRGALAAGLNPAQPPRMLAPAIPPDLSWLAVSGSMYSTTGDLLRWVTAIRSNRRVGFSRQPDAYGWHAEGDSLLEQNGRIPAGYTTQVTTYPRSGLTIIVLSQVQADVVGAITRDVTAIMEGRAYRRPVLRSTAILPDTAVASYVGTYAFAPGFAVTVRRDATGLQLAGPEGDFFPLEPLGGSRFFYRPVYVPVQFVRDSAGCDVLLWNGEARATRVASP